MNRTSSYDSILNEGNCIYASSVLDGRAIQMSVVTYSVDGEGEEVEHVSHIVLTLEDAARFFTAGQGLLSE